MWEQRLAGSGAGWEWDYSTLRLGNWRLPRNGVWRAVLRSTVIKLKWVNLHALFFDHNRTWHIQRRSGCIGRRRGSQFVRCEIWTGMLGKSTQTNCGKRTRYYNHHETNRRVDNSTNDSNETSNSIVTINAAKWRISKRFEEQTIVCKKRTRKQTERGKIGKIYQTTDGKRRKTEREERERSHRVVSHRCGGQKQWKCTDATPTQSEECKARMCNVKRNTKRLKIESGRNRMNKQLQCRNKAKQRKENKSRDRGQSISHWCKSIQSDPSMKDKQAKQARRRSLDSRQSHHCIGNKRRHLSN